MNLVRGQRIGLPSLTSEVRVRVCVEVEGLPAEQVVVVAMLLGERQETISPDAVVSTGRPRSDCGGVALRSDGGPRQRFDLDLSSLAPAVGSVLFALGVSGSIGGRPATARSITRGRWLIEADGAVLACYNFSGSDLGDDAAITLGEVYRKNAVWRARAIGEGFVGGLQAMLSRFKVGPGHAQGHPSGAALPPASSRFCVPGSWPADRAPVVPRDLTCSVGLVVVRGPQDTTRTGTGFVISPGGYFLTCQHVVDMAASVAICLEGTRVLREAEVVAQSSEADLALCWIRDRNGCQDWLLLAGPEANPALGDELGLLGYPLGLDLGLSVTYSQGIINSLRDRGERSLLQIDVGAAPGSSGGPVFRRSDGKVLGVLSGGLEGQDLGMLINFAIDMRMIWRLGWLT